MKSDTEMGLGSFMKNESIACDTCGRFGALEVNGKWLCEECYTLCGSCCHEAEADRQGGSEE